ncbi:unnamed protein product, partial [Owenia fusiformis]
GAAMLQCRPLLNSLSRSLGLLHSSSQNATAATPQAQDDSSSPSLITDPLAHPDFFGVRNLASISELFENKVHLGHKAGTRNEFMTPYIFGNRLGVDIFDLDQSKELLGDALNFTAHIAYNGGVILFISRNSQIIPYVEKTAKEAGEYAHCRFWRGGVFTNSTKQFGAVTRLPDLVIFINMLNNVFEPHIAIRDSAKMLIPTIGIADTNCDPRLITYPVPGNDDTPCAINMYCKLFKEAILKGKAKRRQMEDEE